MSCFSLVLSMFVISCVGIIAMAVCTAFAYQKGYEDGRNYE